MAILITGGHGHIGSWTAFALAETGEEVILFDTNPTVPDCLASVASNITFVQGDVLDFPRLVETFNRQNGKIDGIIHTVGIMAELVLDPPHRNVGLNINGLLNILEIARLFEIPKVLYTSTGAVYGAVSGIADEETFLPNPSDLYGATKVSCEYVGREYAAAFGFDFRVARLYFCYGPGKLPSRFNRLYRLTFGVLEGLKDLQMDKGADQQLDFTYIEDVGRGTALLYRAEQPKHTVYNIATGIPRSVGEVAEVARKYAKFDVDVKLGNGDLMKRCQALDISRAQKELGFQPKYDLEEGIRRYAEWLDRVLPPAAE